MLLSGRRPVKLRTQTDLFAAIVTGAPVTNLVSFYNELCLWVFGRALRSVAA